MNVYEVKGLFSGSWETVFTATSREEGEKILSDYRSNDSSTVYRLVKGRE